MNMPRLPSNSPKKRLNLDLTEEVRNRLENLRMDTDADSLSEVIRRSLALYDLMVREKEAGSTVIIQTVSGKEKQLEFL